MIGGHPEQQPGEGFGDYCLRRWPQAAALTDAVTKGFGCDAEDCCCRAKRVLMFEPDCVVFACGRHGLHARATYVLDPLREYFGTPPAAATTLEHFDEKWWGFGSQLVWAFQDRGLA